MNEQIKDGGPAFPEVVTHLDYSYEADHRFGNTFSYGGMTLRDYFAAKALPAYLSHVSDGGSAILSRCYAEAATEAYEIADAMLKAREAKPCA